MPVKVLDVGHDGVVVRDNVVAIQATGRLTQEDYRKVFLPRMKRVLEAEGSLRILIDMDEHFEGFGAGAIWEDAKFVLSHLRTTTKGKFEKIAFVGGSADPYVRITKSLDFAWPGEIRQFKFGELAEAVAWVNA